MMAEISVEKLRTLRQLAMNISKPVAKHSHVNREFLKHIVNFQAKQSRKQIAIIDEVLTEERQIGVCVGMEEAFAGRARVKMPCIAVEQ